MPDKVLKDIKLMKWLQAFPDINPIVNWWSIYEDGKKYSSKNLWVAIKTTERNVKAESVKS